VTTVAVSVRVRGRVQGVAYRWYCRLEAERLGVTGWIRNEPDESVAGHFEGPAEAVDALVAWCRRGPSYAHVRQVTTSPAAPAAARSFEIRY
jgi:acylphosphatase